MRKGIRDWELNLNRTRPEHTRDRPIIVWKKGTGVRWGTHDTLEIQHKGRRGTAERVLGSFGRGSDLSVYRLKLLREGLRVAIPDDKGRLVWRGGQQL